MPKRPRDHWHPIAVEAAEHLQKRILARADLQQLLFDLKNSQTIPNGTSLETLIDVLMERGQLRLWELQPAPSALNHGRGALPTRRSLHRFVWGDASPLAVALSLRPRSFLSHASAMALHGLTPAIDLPVYANQEQNPKPKPAGRLEQAAIDRAFRNRARVSTYAFRYEDTEIVLLSGKSTGNFGVTEISDAAGRRYPATDIERTLIDATVRPVYAGGVASVLEAYRRAVTMQPIGVLIDRLIATLDALAHVYPYHQAVGFYLERVGASPAEIAPIRARGLSYDFYLDYEMTAPAFDASWRIHYPRDLS